MDVSNILITPLGYEILGACIQKNITAPVRACTLLEIVDILIEVADEGNPFSESNQTVYRQLESLRRDGLLKYSGRSGKSNTYYITKEGAEAFDLGVGEVN